MNATRQSNLRLFCGAAIATALLLGSTPAIRAGNLDRALMQNSGKVIEYLDQKKIKNVGVLPFQVKKGDRRASFNAAPLAQNMPTRLENTLIMTLGEDSFGVVRNAAMTASKAKVGAYMTRKADFDKLFATKYTRAWDGAKVNVDLFLTGVVINSSAHRDKTIVVISGFGRDSWQNGKVIPKIIHKFDVKTDRLLLADQGYNFALSRSALSKKMTSRKRNQLAVSLVSRRDLDGETKTEAGQSNAYSPENIAGFNFEVYYDDEKQEIKKVEGSQSGTKAPEYEIPPAPIGAKIKMYLTRTLKNDATLGVVLKVNGQSTWDKENIESTVCRRWIYPPSSVNRRDAFEGFYLPPDGSKFLRFKTLGMEDAGTIINEMGSRAGWIDIDVFGSKTLPQPKVDDDDEKKDPDVKKNPKEKDKGEKDKDKDDADDDVIITKSVPATKKGSSFKAYQVALLKANRQKRKEGLVAMRTVGGIVYHETEAEESAAVAETGLPDAELIGHLSIRYWAGKSGNGGGGAPTD